MAYPTGMLAVTLEDLDRQAIQLKAYAQRANTAMAAGSVTSTQILDVYKNMVDAKARLTAGASVPGIAQFAKDQKNNQDLDVVAEFTAMLDAIDDVGGWISTNFPKDGNGYLLAQTLSASGAVDRTFTSAATAGLRTQLTALIGTIG